MKSCSIAGFLMAVAALSAGCGRSSSTTTTTGPDGEKVTVTKKGNDEEIVFKSQGGFEGKEGAEVHYAGGKTGVALPKGFPDDVAVYPKATVAMSATEQNSLMVMLKTPDAAGKAETFYKDSLEKNGWKIQQTMNTGQGAILMAEKKDRKVTITVTPESEGTVIQIILAP